MSWARTLKRHGYIQEENGTYDPFYVVGTPGAAAGGPTAQVKVELRTSTDYGQVSCAVTVTLTCPQLEQAINLAGELAFRKGLELVNDGASHLGIPKLPPFQGD